jgi:threonine dehydratase
MEMRLPTFSDVTAAAARLGGVAVATPLLRSAELDRQCGATVLLKAEPLQRTGSFKFRGAYNRLAQLNDSERRTGVVAWSSGNHAQGVAAAAAMLGIPATIVMPADAPAIKVERTRGYGADIVTYDRATADREAIARDIAAHKRAIIVPSYDDPHVIAGQGTIGLEVMNQARALGLSVDAIIAPASGGGLIAGIGLAARAISADVALFTAEPAGYDDHRLSLIAGARQRNTSTANAFCDALLTSTPGELTWAWNGKTLSGGYAVSDDAVREAMAWAFEALKIVVEPSGAAALAALRAGHHPRSAGPAVATVVVILSGGNVDRATFRAALKPSFPRFY